MDPSLEPLTVSRGPRPFESSRQKETRRISMRTSSARSIRFLASMHWSETNHPLPSNSSKDLDLFLSDDLVKPDIWFNNGCLTSGSKGHSSLSLLCISRTPFTVRMILSFADYSSILCLSQYRFIDQRNRDSASHTVPDNALPRPHCLSLVFNLHRYEAFVAQHRLCRYIGSWNPTGVYRLITLGMSWLSYHLCLL